MPYDPYVLEADVAGAQEDADDGDKTKVWRFYEKMAQVMRCRPISNAIDDYMDAIDWPGM